MYIYLHLLVSSSSHQKCVIFSCLVGNPLFPMIQLQSHILYVLFVMAASAEDINE